MKRFAKHLFVAVAVAASSFGSVSLVSACGGRGGRVAAPLYGGYARAASNYRTTLPATPPIHNVPKTYHTSTYPSYPYQVSTHQAATITPPAMPHSRVLSRSTASVQPRPRAQVAARTAARTVVSVSKPAAAPKRVEKEPVSPSDAETSALAALAAITSDKGETAKATSASSLTSTPGHVGRFRASLPNSITVELNLDRSGTFSWTVISQGKTSKFSGNYRLSEGRLTLVRSTDLETMAGQMKVVQNGFTFQLDGSGNAQLKFQKV